ncbi:MAG: CvpA family protein [Burkholderiaceae bacterium]|nr:CvpA family protein [Burkholderiaceae bacterium]
MPASVAALTGWDYFVVAALLISIALGVMRGLVRTVFALAGWVIALLGAPLAAGPLLAATGWALHPLFVVALLFFVLLVSVRLLGALIARALARVGLGSLDRALGAALGVVRAMIIVLLVALVGHHLGADRAPAWQNAWSRPLLDALLAWIEPHLPSRPGKLETVHRPHLPAVAVLPRARVLASIPMSEEPGEPASCAEYLAS